MAIYTWSGTNFSTPVVTQFFVDNTGSFLFYEKNYNAFFHVSDPATTGNIPVYAPGGSNEFQLSAGAVLTALDQYSAQVSTFNTSILTERMNSWENQVSNILKDFTQSPSALVTMLLNSGGVNSLILNEVEKLKALTPVLVDKATNFALQEVLNKWPGGQNIIKDLNTTLLGLQNKATGATQGSKTISDFKTKLIRQSTQIADETSKLQQQAQKILSDNTFTALVSAFPGSMGPIVSLVQNAEAKYRSELAALLPSTGLDGTSIQGIVSGLFAGKIPVITSAIDKLSGDINELESGFNQLVASFPTNGFHSLQDLSNVCNQSVNLLNNLLKDLPISASIQIPNPVTDATQIVNAIQSEFNKSLGLVSSNITGATAAIQSIITMASDTQVASAIMVMEPFIGGSLAHTAALSGILHSHDPSMTTPNLTASADPSIASKQVLDAGRQTLVDAQGKPRKAKRGECINTLEEFPLRPRNKPLDGSPGTYNVSAKIDY